MSQNIMAASREWASRPEDQRFVSLADLKASVEARRRESWTATPKAADLRVLPVDGSDDLAVELYDPTKGERRALTPTNWGFSQLSGYAKAPAAYLRQLPAELAAINLQWGLEKNAQREEALVLARSNGDNHLLAMTSTSYGRIWDLDVVLGVERVNQSGRWHVPAASYAATNPKRATTLYASDRDVFIFLVDDKNPLDVPAAGGRQKKMFRGFYTWNSEVGSAVFGLTTFLYDFVCDNRIIWGATNVQELRIRHTGGAPDRFAYEGVKYLERYGNESTDAVLGGIKAAQGRPVPVEFSPHDDKGNNGKVQGWLVARGFTKAQAKASVEAAVNEEGQARSLWDIVNGVTAYARSVPHTDERVQLEQRAGKLMELAK